MSEKELKSEEVAVEAEAVEETAPAEEETTVETDVAAAVVAEESSETADAAVGETTSTGEHIEEAKAEPAEEADTQMPVIDVLDPSEYGSVNPAYESLREREILEMTERRNAPDDVAQAKEMERNLFQVDYRPKASAAFRLVEAFISATAWPGATIASAVIAMLVVIGTLPPIALIAPFIIIVLSACGFLLKKHRRPKFSLIQDDVAYKWTGAVKDEVQEHGCFKTVRKVQRRALKVGEYGEIFSSIMLVLSFVILALFIPVPVAYFVSMVIVFATAWSMAGDYVSSSAPYCDVYDIQFDDKSSYAVISFDTPIPGEERYMTPIDKEAVLFALRPSTRTFLSGQSQDFELGEDGCVRRRILD